MGLLIMDFNVVCWLLPSIFSRMEMLNVLGKRFLYCILCVLFDILINC